MIVSYLDHLGGNFRSYLLLDSTLLKKPVKHLIILN